MKTKEVKIEFPKFQEDDFLKFNHNHSNLFITKYADQRDEDEGNS